MVPYHRILEETGFARNFYSLMDDIREISPYVLRNYPEVSLSYEWDNSFDKDLYNAKRTIQNIDIEKHKSEQQVECTNMICRALADKKQYQDTKITGDCINTNNKEVIMDIEKVLVENLGHDQNSLAARQFKKLLQTNVKTRLMKEIDNNYMEEIIEKISLFILSTCQDYCEKMDKMFEDEIFPGILNSKELNKLLMKFKRKVLKEKAIYMKTKNNKRNPGNRNLKTIQKFLKVLQKFITFLKHDKKKGDTQIMCNQAAERVAIISVEQQNRFTIQHNGHQQKEEAKQKIRKMIEDKIVTADTNDAMMQNYQYSNSLQEYFLSTLIKHLRSMNLMKILQTTNHIRKRRFLE